MSGKAAAAGGDTDFRKTRVRVAGSRSGLTAAQDKAEYAKKASDKRVSALRDGSAYVGRDDADRRYQIAAEKAQKAGACALTSVPLCALLRDLSLAALG